MYDFLHVRFYLCKLMMKSHFKLTPFTCFCCRQNSISKHGNPPAESL